jgi:hypothetical protein
MRRIIAGTVPHLSQRYSTQGDFYDIDGVTLIKVSDFGNEDIEYCIFIHEAIEQYLCRKRGIKEEDITKFDIESGLEDPGLSPDAPYHKEHMFAVKVEKMMAKELGMKWRDYYASEPL